MFNWKKGVMLRKERKIKKGDDEGEEYKEKTDKKRGRED